MAVAAVTAMACGGAGDTAAERQPARARPAASAGDQKKLPLLERHARQALRADYGGIWIDARGDERIKLAVRSLDPRRRRAARRAVVRAALKGRVDLVAVRRGEDELERLRLRLDRELVKVNRGAVDHVDAVPNPPLGVIDLLTPVKRAHTTPAQRRFLEGAPRRFGHRVRIRKGPGPGRLD